MKATDIWFLLIENYSNGWLLSLWEHSISGKVARPTSNKQKNIYIFFLLSYFRVKSNVKIWKCITFFLIATLFPGLLFFRCNLWRHAFYFTNRCPFYDETTKGSVLSLMKEAPIFFVSSSLSFIISPKRCFQSTLYVVFNLWFYKLLPLICEINTFAVW